MSLTPIALEIDQGDDETITIAAKLPTTPVTPADLTNCKLWFAIGTSPVDTPLLEKSSPSNGILITDAANGLAEVTISKADTTALGTQYLGRQLKWECQLKDATNKITTVARGSIVINNDMITEFV